MIVTNATIAMASRHQYQETHELEERLLILPEARDAVASPHTQASQPAPVNISPHGFSLNLLASQVNRQRFDLTTGLDAQSRINLLILQMMFEQVMGRPLHLMAPADVNQSERGASTSLDLALPLPPTTNATAGGLVYERRERYRETEQLVFQATGLIETADGRTISFGSSLRMSRDYYEESSLIIRQGQVASIDPLVINFDGKGAALSQTRFAFDLDSDGTEDQIAMLGSGSGFLALDRNGDGTINDGSELFGPSSGRGFEELAQYDEDSNQFIDEADSIYSRLRIWLMNEDGSSQLVGLGEKGIGAIYLGHVTSPFQLKDQQNRSLGEVVNSGVYLTETGEVGTVQEINLTV
ncbi:hypothetical protein [Cellvibrio sp. PSBB006]|uniref:hypothetical protein n=1 Tax=Cellvibrio sp. PSBB006 TaxID=1987723 RepID=UPI000B3B4E46|nr:hypothetical protein [Cellvibrio sp. PSBB006]ARU29672.1 hypothetical protein CBR65_20760 [Cellvibrio sp. PSBB006]